MSKSIEELCAPGHERHMQAIGQKQWLEETLKRADERRAADEAQLNQDVKTFRETGRWPRRPAKKKTSGKRSS